MPHQFFLSLSLHTLKAEKKYFTHFYFYLSDSVEEHLHKPVARLHCILKGGFQKWKHLTFIRN